MVHLQAKKIETHLKKHRNTGHGYNNEENPFGDSNLGDSFVWGKKIQKQLDEGADKRDLTAKAERQRQFEREVRWPCFSTNFSVEKRLLHSLPWLSM